MTTISLPLSTIACPGTAEFPSDTAEQAGLFIVHHSDGVSAFLNRCPHNGSELNWQPNQFFDRDGEYLICALHGALFQPTDGQCIAGPCRGQSLTPLPINVADGQVEVKISTAGD